MLEKDTEFGGQGESGVKGENGSQGDSHSADAVNAADANVRQADEIASLQAIYDGSLEVQLCIVTPLPASGSSSCAVEVRVQVLGIITACFVLPHDYPASSSPELTIKIGGVCSFEAARSLAYLSTELETLLEQELGNEVLFVAIETIRDKASGMKEEPSETTCDAAIEMAPACSATASVFQSTLAIYHSTALVERKSTFIAHCCEVRSMDQVLEFRCIVLADKRYGRATHNIFAYRFTCGVSGVVHNDCDDDGESAAGARLAEMLRLMNLTRGVAIVVSRWFGGQLLGPDRFKLINNTARHLLEEQGFA